MGRSVSPVRQPSPEFYTDTDGHRGPGGEGGAVPAPTDFAGSAAEPYGLPPSGYGMPPPASAPPTTYSSAYAAPPPASTGKPNVVPSWMQAELRHNWQ